MRPQANGTDALKMHIIEAPTFSSRSQSTVTQFFRVHGNELSDFGWTEVAHVPESNDKQRMTYLISTVMEV